MDLAASTGAGLVGVIASGVGAVAETVQAVMRRVVYAEQLGAVGNGSANDALSLNRAIASAVSQGAELHLQPGKTYRIDATVTASSPVTIYGNGATISTPNNIIMLAGSSGLKVFGVRFVGPSSTFASNGIGISVRGTVNGAATPPTFQTDIVVKDCSFNNIPYGAIDLRYVQRALIWGNVTTNTGYHGLMTVGCEDVVEIGAVVDTLTGEIDTGDPATSQLNAFGTSWACNDNDTDYIRYPSSKRCVSYNGTYRNILTWQAMDTHGGEYCGFVSPTVINCRRAVWLTARAGRGPIGCFATDVYAVNTTASASVSANNQEQRGEAIAIVGAESPGQPAKNCFASGYLKGYGAVKSRSAALYTVYAEDCTVDLNIVDPYTGGVRMDKETSRLSGRVSIRNPQNPGTGAGGFTNDPRYLDVTAINAEVCTATLDVTMIRDNPALNTYVGTLAIAVSGTVTQTVLDFQRVSIDDGISTTVSGPLGNVVGAYPLPFSMNVSGFSDLTTTTLTGFVINKQVTLNLAQTLGTSNSTDFILGSTGKVPVHLRPPANTFATPLVQDNGVNMVGLAVIGSDGTISFYKDATAGSFTASGTKRAYRQSFTYSLS